MYCETQKLLNFVDISDTAEAVPPLRINTNLHHLRPLSVISFNIIYKGPTVMHSVMNLLPEMFFSLMSSRLCLWVKSDISSCVSLFILSARNLRAKLNAYSQKICWAM